MEASRVTARLVVPVVLFTFVDCETTSFKCS